MKRIKKFGVLKTAVMLAILFFVYSLLIIIPMSVRMVKMNAFSLFVLFTPFISSAVVFIFSVILCLAYNLLAPKIGGIEIDIE